MVILQKHVLATKLQILSKNYKDVQYLF